MRDEPEMRNCFQCEVSLNMSQAKKGILLVNAYSHEETTEALHVGRESRHSEEAFGGRSADLGSV